MEETADLSSPDPPRRDGCYVVASGSHPHVLPCTLRCDPSLRLAPATFSTARVFKMLQAYARIMVKGPKVFVKNSSNVSERFLLRDAVNSSESDHQRSTWNSKNLAGWKKFPEDAESCAIVRMAVSRDDYEPVGNIKIGITRRQSAPLMPHRTGHRKCDKRKLSSLLVPGSLQALIIFH
jgi:hypothetical protein